MSLVFRKNIIFTSLITSNNIILKLTEHVKFIITFIKIYKRWYFAFDVVPENKKTEGIGNDCETDL